MEGLSSPVEDASSVSCDANRVANEAWRKGCAGFRLRQALTLNSPNRNVFEVRAGSAPKRERMASTQDLKSVCGTQPDRDAGLAGFFGLDPDCIIWLAIAVEIAAKIEGIPGWIDVVFQIEIGSNEGRYDLFGNILALNFLARTWIAVRKKEQCRK